MRIAFCTACKNRLQHLRETLARNLIDNADYANLVFVVLDYGDDPSLGEYLRNTFSEQISSGRLVVYRYETHGPFRMAHAKNMSHRAAMLEGADVLVNMDADNYTGVGFAQWIADTFTAGMFLWSRMVQRCNQPIDAQCCILPRNHVEPCTHDMQTLSANYSPDERPRVRGISGRLAMSANAYRCVGGYDEKYQDYGPDDQDMNKRLRRLGLIAREIPARFLGAIHHSSKMRFRDYPHAADRDSAWLPVVPALDTCVVNFGFFGCGEVSRNFEPPFDINPIPTRIFGIGMHKTATSSLSAALNMLGLDCAHWISPKWARDIWSQMRTTGKSLTMEQHYSLTDFPIGMIYQELDLAYPNSKFILTLRSETAWLKSVRDHWDYKRNPWRSDWDWDCFSHRMHHEIYGRKSFDADIFLERYRRHNQEVLDYFKGRTDDLLVMNTGDQWDGLCRFLHLPMPNSSYPRVNVT